MRLDAFPRQFAATRRFTLGAPGRFTVSPDGARVLFVRSASPRDPRGLLWRHEDGREQLLADHPGGGVTSYATDRAVRLAAYTVDGELWTVPCAGGAPRRLPAPGPVQDPRPSPDGSLVAYVSGGALRVLRADGTGDRPLAEPESAEVTYGLADHVARSSIGRTRGYWWAPSGNALLVARVDTKDVARFHIGDPARPWLPPRVLPYPMAGTANARTTLCLLTPDGGRVPVALPETAPGEGWGRGVAYVTGVHWSQAGPVVVTHTRDQRTLWALGVDPATGATTTLWRRSGAVWAEPLPGTPLCTASGVPVVPEERGDAYTVRIGDRVAPPGLQVRAVLGAVGERVLFTASEEPTQTHVWAYEAGEFTRLTHEPGVHTAAAGGGTLVVDSGTPTGRSVTVLRDGAPVGHLAVHTEVPVVTPRPRHLELGERGVRARLHLPSGHTPGERLPVLLSPYAGPGFQLVTRAAGWHDTVCQWFAEHGFAVLVADGRGTPGRGVRWRQAVAGDRLGPVLDDQVDALAAAAALHGDLDLDRVGIRGWSFSGYLAAGAVLHRPDVFRTAVAGAPLTDARLYDTYWQERFLGHPELEPEVYRRNSLIPYAHLLTRPLLLVHGLCDDNVVPAHTLRLSAALLAAGRPHQVLPLAGEGHSIADAGVAAALLGHEHAFLRRTLGA